jgi:hypothetical protein
MTLKLIKLAGMHMYTVQCHTIGLPDVSVSGGQSLDSDLCSGRKSVPGMPPVFCKLSETPLVFVNSKTNKLNL